MNTISDSFYKINRFISNFSLKSNLEYNPSIIAVSKGQNISAINSLLELGHYDFGENKLQEASLKIDNFTNSKINWHFIGRIQTNKIKKIAYLFDYVHSLDSVEKVFELNRRCNQIGKIMKVFIQVNTSLENQKSGIIESELFDFLQETSKLSNIQFIGLMTIATLSAEENVIRRSFSNLSNLQKNINNNFPEIKHLSMGMSNDYKIALEEGATYLRLGRAIFGQKKI